MVSSLDGFIAKFDNSISWFNTADHYEAGIALSEQDIAAFLKTIDCYVMGSKTYELALALSEQYGWAYGDIPTVVLTHRKLPIIRPNVEFYSGDLDELINKHLKPKYKNIWVAGGPTIASEMIRLKLADEIRQSILPIVLGEGKPFFSNILQELNLHLKDVKAYKNGTVELQYEIKNSTQ